MILLLLLSLLLLLLLLIIIILLLLLLLLLLLFGSIKNRYNGSNRSMQSDKMISDTLEFTGE